MADVRRGTSMHEIDGMDGPLLFDSEAWLPPSGASDKQPRVGAIQALVTPFVTGGPTKS